MHLITHAMNRFGPNFSYSIPSPSSSFPSSSFCQQLKFRHLKSLYPPIIGTNAPALTLKTSSSQELLQFVGLKPLFSLSDLPFYFSVMHQLKRQRLCFKPIV